METITASGVCGIALDYAYMSKCQLRFCQTELKPSCRKQWPASQMYFMKMELRLIIGGSSNCRQTLLFPALEFENHVKGGHGKQKYGLSRNDAGREEREYLGDALCYEKSLKS
jgi:hypothetical protein